jgi:hypothetical protein
MTMEKKGHYIVGGANQYAQGPISYEFKGVMRQRIDHAESEADFEKFLNDMHDAMLICRNDRDGLQAAVKHLVDTSNQTIIESD